MLKMKSGGLGGERERKNEHSITADPREQQWKQFLDDGDTGRALGCFFLRVALEQLFYELLESSEVTLTLPGVVVSPLRKDAEALSPRRRQLVQLLHHDRWDELVRQARNEKRGHAAECHISVRKEFVLITPKGQVAHREEGEERGCHVRNT